MEHSPSHDGFHLENDMKIFLIIALVIAVCTPYIWNGYKFVSCDFEAGYKCEALHGIGVIIPPAAFVTVWFDSDN